MNPSDASQFADSNQSLRWLMIAIVSASLIVSLLSLYTKLYFWDGQQYSPFYVKAATWFVILAGPTAAIFHKRQIAALVLVVAQIGIVIAASI